MPPVNTVKGPKYNSARIQAHVLRMPLKLLKIITNLYGVKKKEDGFRLMVHGKSGLRMVGSMMAVVGSSKNLLY